MNAREVMTSPVVSVSPDQTVDQVASVLLSHRISAAPVVEHERLAGIVSGGDLIRRAEIGTAERPRARWRRFFKHHTVLAMEYAKAYSARVGDVMTRNVITVDEDTALADVVALLEKHRIRRVPVMCGTQLTGILSYSDLVRGVVKARAAKDRSLVLDDDAIRENLLATLRFQPWTSLRACDVTVRNGVVEYWGLCRSEEGMVAERVVAENIPGVFHVEDHRMLKGAERRYASAPEM